MKRINLFGKVASVGLAVSLGLMVSCKDDEDRLTLQDTQDISEEALIDSYYKDLDDIGSVLVDAPSDDEYEGGRKAATITIDDDRFCENVIVSITPTGNADLPKGTITVNFGTAGCEDSRKNTRRGKVIFTYTGRRFQPGSTVVTTVENYSINGIKLEGTRTSTNVSGSTEDVPKFNVVLSNGKATFGDGAVATRTSDITWSWVRGANPLLDKLVIDKASVAEGVTRNGRTYKVSLTENLVYERTCFIATEGVKKYLIDGEKEIVIDYGSGDCKAVAVTVNGVTRSINI